MNRLLVLVLGSLVGVDAGRGTALLIAAAGLCCLALLPLAASRGLRAVVVSKAPPDQAPAPVAEGN